jgi:Zn-dependent protease with chaperone function
VAGTKLTPPRLTISKVAAVGVAAMVHSVTFILAALGLALAIRSWPNLLAVAIGLLCLGIAFLLRPRFGTPPELFAPREEFPAIYKLVDDVAAELKAVEVDRVVFDDSFNASFAVLGLRRRRVVTIGVPLFLLLDPQERVAIIGHEIAHSVNGDSSRGLFVGSAISSLSSWHHLLRPASLLSSESGLPGLLMLPVNVFLFALAGLPWAGAFVLSHLLCRDSQRAEYYADQLGAVMAGGTAACGVLAKTHLESMFHFAVQKAVLGDAGRGVFEELRHQYTTTPEREKERILRVAAQDEGRLDYTHPPTHYRIDHIRSLSLTEPKLLLSEAASEKIDEEIGAVAPRLERAILESYRTSLLISAAPVQ